MRGHLQGSVAAGAATEQALRLFGIETGTWRPRVAPVSSLPQLNYARELRVLERRFGTVFTDRIRLRPRPASARGTQPAAEPAQEHLHDEHEVRAVVEGRALFVFRHVAVDGVTAILAEAGDWIALPPGLPHAIDAGARPRLDMLRLFSARGGWLARQAPPRLRAPLPTLDDLAAEIEPAEPAMA